MVSVLQLCFHPGDQVAGWGTQCSTPLAPALNFAEQLRIVCKRWFCGVPARDNRRSVSAARVWHRLASGHDASWTRFTPHPDKAPLGRIIHGDVSLSLRLFHPSDLWMRFHCLCLFRREELSGFLPMIHARLSRMYAQLLVAAIAVFCWRMMTCRSLAPAKSTSSNGITEADCMLPGNPSANFHVQTK